MEGPRASQSPDTPKDIPKMTNDLLHTLADGGARVFWGPPGSVASRGTKKFIDMCSDSVSTHLMEFRALVGMPMINCA